jgi:hypothetical protein
VTFDGMPKTAKLHGSQSSRVDVDFDDGHVSGRIELPAPTFDATRTTSEWALYSSVVGGHLTVHWTADRTEIVWMHAVVPQRIALTQLPADSEVVVRGT